MAMIICPECEGNLSDLAEVCPHCGYPIKRITEEQQRKRMQMQNNSFGNENQNNIVNQETHNIEPSRTDMNQGMGNSANYSYNTINNVGINSNNRESFVNTENISYNSTVIPTKKDTKKDSPFSIVAAILSLVAIISFGPAVIVGLVFAILDVTLYRNNGKRHLGAYFCMVVSAIAIFLMITQGYYGFMVLGEKKRRYNSGRNSINVEESYKEQKNDSLLIDENDFKEDVKISTSGKSEMYLREIGEVDDVCIGLVHVKTSDTLTNSLGTEESASPGNEVLVGFFELYNDSNKIVKVNPEDITCYADGVQVGSIETYIKTEVDNVKQFYNTEMDPKTKIITCNDFEVPKGWKAVTFYYKSLSWSVLAEDVNSEPYNMSFLFDKATNRDSTSIDTCIYSGDYSIIYKGIEKYTKKDVVFGDEKYIVFKFRVENKSDKPLDYSFAGYRMRAYENGYNLMDASFIIDDNINGYLNIFNVDTIQSGKVADVYVAFESNGLGNVYECAYDDGYISDAYKGYVVDYYQ